METHVTTVGILNIVYSLLGILGGLVVMLVLGSTGTFLAFVEEVPLIGAIAASGVGVLIGSFIILFALPGFLGGFYLLKYEEWARIVILIVAFLHLFNCPFGTALGIYSFWVLLQEETTALFKVRRDAWS